MADYFKADGGVFFEKEKNKITVNVFNVREAYLYSGAYYVYASRYYYQTEAPRKFRVSVNYKF
jgi:iron complex outermembrane receptor protein